MTPRPVFGEIMTRKGGGTSPRPAVSGDVLDAHILGTHEPEGGSPPRIAGPAGMTVLDGHRPVPAGKHGGPLFWTLGLALVGFSFWISGGYELLPERAKTGATPSLTIASVESRIEGTGDGATLLVEGEARNEGSSVHPLPAILIAVEETGGSTLHYRVASDGRALQPGAVHFFSGRLRLSEAGVKKVAVSFQPHP